MLSRLSRVHWGAIAVTAGALAVAGCSSSSSSGAAAKPSGSSSASQSSQGSLTASQAIQQAARNAGQVTSFAASVDVRTTGAATSTITGTLQQRTEPSPLVVTNFSNVTTQGQTIPGGIQEILNSSAIYVKLAQLTQATGRPWIKIPVSELSAIAGGSFGQLLQNSSSNPLLQTQMLASSANVKKVGTTTLDGIPVTEYTGTYPITAGLARLPASMRSKVGQQLQAMGLQTESFRIWLDHSQQVRRVVSSAQGSKEQVTTTLQVTAINEPVSAAIPPAAETTTVPASELGASGNAKPGTTS